MTHFLELFEVGALVVQLAVCETQTAVLLTLTRTCVFGKRHEAAIACVLHYFTPRFANSSLA